jgi:hypothetical protein
VQELAIFLAMDGPGCDPARSTSSRPRSLPNLRAGSVGIDGRAAVVMCVRSNRVRGIAVGRCLPAARKAGMSVVLGSICYVSFFLALLEAVCLPEAPKRTGSVGDVDDHVPVGLLAFD